MNATRIAVLLILLVTPVVLARDGDDAATIVRHLGWLEGRWVGNLGSRRYETSYSGPEGGVILAASKELAGDRVAVFDYERIWIREGRVVLTPSPFGRESDTFPLLRYDASKREAVFENLEHDFPKRFTYRLAADDRLLITLEGKPGGPRLQLDLRRALSSEARPDDGPLLQHLRNDGKSPASYVHSKLGTHRVVLLGEHHWIRHDVELVRDLVPSLPGAGVTTLASELFPASEQERIDRLVASHRWNRAEAVAVLQRADWPYEEYLQILEAAWTTNRSLPKGTSPLSVLALGPGKDWRDRLLPMGETYDTFMAKRVLERIRSTGGKALVHCGSHHAFTRYLQPEMPREGRRVDRFMERTGNVLRRELGEDVFFILLHYPFRRLDAAGGGHVLPAGGSVDRAASRFGKPVGFDVATGPFADLILPPETYYAAGYPRLRLGDLADGWIWQKPMGKYAGVAMIPLDEVLAAEAEDGASRQELENRWKSEAQRLRGLPKSSGWATLEVGAPSR